MKKVLLFTLVIGLIFSFQSSFSQNTTRTKTIGMEKYRSIIGNQNLNHQVPAANREAGILFFSENFDGTGGALPNGWSRDGNSVDCMWGVDSSPNPWGYYSNDYSLNYNNGVDFNCDNNWGWVQTAPIPVGGSDFEIRFQFVSQTECGVNNNSNYVQCGWDETYITVYDDNGPIFNTCVDYIAYGNPGWTEIVIPVTNINQAENITIEFYFDTYDSSFNDYPGAFIDNLEIYGTPSTPVSGWAIGLGIALIVGFTLLRLRRTF